MKKSIIYSFLLIGLLTSCSPDNSGDDIILDVGNETDIFGEDYNFTSFSAVDEGNGQVSFGIITYDNIGKGTYPVEFRLAPELYNGYINFVEDPTVNPIYGPAGGHIKLIFIDKNKISGSVDVSCYEPNSNKSITIKGDFTAIKQ